MYTDLLTTADACHFSNSASLLSSVFFLRRMSLRQLQPTKSAELYAILLALAVIRRSKENNFVIFSDSMSSLQALSGFKLEIHFVQNIIKDYTHLTNSGKTIILCWMTSHVNIVGNERADTEAKSALSLPITNMKLPAGELFPQVSKFCLNEWQEIWDLSLIHI